MLSGFHITISYNPFSLHGPWVVFFYGFLKQNVGSGGRRVIAWAYAINAVFKFALFYYYFYIFRMNNIARFYYVLEYLPI